MLVELLFDNLSSVGTHARSGRVRGIAVSGLRRSPSFPDLPTIDESGVPGYETLAWGGLVAPANLPAELLARLNAELNKALQSQAVRDGYFTMGFEASGGTPADFAAYVKSEIPKWEAVIRRAGAKME